MQDDNNRQKHLLLSIFLLVLLSYPLISIANKPGLVAGIPALYLYIFSVWIIIIIILNRLAKQKRPKNDE